MMTSDSETSSRRDLLRTAGAAAAAFMIVPRHVLGGTGFVPPSDKVTMGFIGVGAQGTRVMAQLLKEPDVQGVAVCDVNKQSSDYVEWGQGEMRNTIRRLLGDDTWGSQFTGATAGRDPAQDIVNRYNGKKNASGAAQGCAAYNDFRELLARADVDAVMICTPDHWHAPIAIASMRAKKHVYCQKPMAHAPAEAREMARVARETGVATQVALAVSASEYSYLLQEWLAAGVIGPVRVVQNWSSRPFWPQGVKRPEDEQPIPEGLDWNLWLGPAPERPFNHAYLPFVWRGWYDFGCGCLGDMGQYAFDTVFRALKLGPPVAVEASSTPLFKESFPVASIVRYEFAARGTTPPVTYTWYDGGLRPPRPPELPDNIDLSGEAHEGLLFIGDKGTIMCGFEGENPRLIPEEKMKAFQPPPKTLPRSPGHYREFLMACKGEKITPLANFEFEAPIGEAVLLGNIAVRTGQKLRWDSKDMKIANNDAAQELVYPHYRGKWG